MTPKPPFIAEVARSRVSALALVALALAGCGPATEPDRPAEDRAAREQAAAGAAEPSAPETIADPGQAVARPAAYAEEIHGWQAERESSLRRPEGWLSLVGLFWLDEGASSFGGAEDNAVVFPPSPGGDPPDRAGVFYLEDGTVRLEVEPGVDVRVDLEDPSGAEAADRDSASRGKPVTETVMVPDTREGTTRLALGSFRFWVIERGDRLGVRLLDRQSAALGAFEGLGYFPVDPAWRIEARLERRDGLTVSVPNVLGQISEQPCPGELVFQVPGELPGEPGRELRLLPMAAGDELFIVFGDETNGDGTYGGGRFLYADAPEPEDSRVVLDFNRAYNPPCAFTEYATCPLPPRPNKLPVAIPAGERAYAGGPAHH